MRQSTVIFGSMVFAFVIYVTLRGQLPTYLALFSSGKSPASGGGSNAAAASPSARQSIFGMFSGIVPDIVEGPANTIIHGVQDMYSNMGMK